MDERTGAYGAVRLGSSAANVRAAFGVPAAGSGYYPAGHEGASGPTSIPTPGGRRPTLLRYEDVAFLAAEATGVYSLKATDAVTSTGVGVGDALDRVRELYRGARCGEDVAGEPFFRDEAPTYPWCRARVGDVDIFFAGDPVEAITLTRLSRE